MIETTGYKLFEKEAALKPKAPEQKAMLADLEGIEMENKVPKKADKYIANAKNLLRQEFNFYTFGLELNQEHRVDIMDKVYNRALEKALIDESKQREAMTLELTSVRQMVKEFKNTEEESTKIIADL